MKTTSEQTFPIYRVKVRWSEEWKEGQERYPARPGSEPLPENRYWNSCGWDRMAKDDLDTQAFVDELRREWWPAYAEKKLNKPDDLTIEVELKGRDTWCEGWFSHYTIDIGLSDREVLDSFERYVDRIQYNYDLTESQRGGALMGAEDRWRWYGCANGDPQGERTPAPCRCEHCKKSGLIRIDH